MGNNIRQMALLGIAGVLLVALALKFVFSGGPDLTAQLKSTNVQQRLDAIRELGRRGSNGDLMLVGKYCRDEETEVAQAALLAVGRRDWPQGIDFVIDAMQDSREAVREAAMISLGRHHRKNVDHALVIGALTNDASANVRAAAARTAGEALIWGAMPALVEMLFDDEHARIRGRACAAIRTLVGVDHRYKADARVNERHRVASEIRNVWKSYEPYHRKYLERLDAQGK